MRNLELRLITTCFATALVFVQCQTRPQSNGPKPDAAMSSRAEENCSIEDVAIGLAGASAIDCGLAVTPVPGPGAQTNLLAYTKAMTCALDAWGARRPFLLRKSDTPGPAGEIYVFTRAYKLEILKSLDMVPEYVRTECASVSEGAKKEGVLACAVTSTPAIKCRRGNEPTGPQR
jgi:hypothetical protein